LGDGPDLSKDQTTPKLRLQSVHEDDFSQSSDEEVLDSYRESQCQDAFHELVRRFERPLYRYLVRYLGDEALAEDVLQNTFLQVHSKCGLFCKGQPVRPWLYAIATHQAIDALRRAKASRRSHNGESSQLQLVDRSTDESTEVIVEIQEEERRRWVRDTVANLSETKRQVLILAYYQGLKYREIAEILGIPIGTVKTRLHMAIATLQKRARAAHLIDAG